MIRLVRSLRSPSLFAAATVVVAVVVVVVVVVGTNLVGYGFSLFSAA